MIPTRNHARSILRRATASLVVAAALAWPATAAATGPREPLELTVGVSALSRHLPFGFRGPDGALVSPFLTVERGRLTASLATMQYTLPAGELRSMGFAGAGLDVAYRLSISEKLSATVGYQAATAPAFGIDETQAITASASYSGGPWGVSAQAFGDFRAGSGVLAVATVDRTIGRVHTFASAGYNHRYFHEGSGVTFLSVGASTLHTTGALVLEPNVSYTAPLAPSAGRGLALGLTVSLAVKR